MLILALVALSGCNEIETTQPEINEPVIILEQNNTVEVEEVENNTPEPEVIEPFCGDNTCDDNESQCSCPADCGECVGSKGTCLELSCVKGECIKVKEKDCCGNGICESKESASSCDEDCPDYDLSDFPKPFTNAVVIVGAQGFNTDPSAALKILNSIGSNEGAIMDYEISSLGSMNSIIIGGPCQNTWAKEFYGELEDCDDFTEGKGIVKIFKTGTKYSLLVAGKTAQDTLATADKVSKSSLSGNEYVLN